MSARETIVVWINAFIPGEVPGYTQKITRGENQGKTAVPMPGVARLAPGNTLRSLGVGYLTDQRTFSDNDHASVRMQSRIVFKLNPPGELSGLHQTSGTRQVNIDSGETQDDGEADMSKCKHSRLYEAPFGFSESIYNDLQSGKAKLEEANSYTLFLNGPIRSRAKPWNSASTRDLTKPYGMMVNVVGAASDPLVHFAADIDYDVTFVVGIDPAHARIIVACIGFVDAFPAYECYARFAGTTQTLFTLPPPKGNTVTNLLGGPNRSVTGATSFDLRCRAKSEAPDAASFQDLLNTLLGHGSTAAAPARKAAVR